MIRWITGILVGIAIALPTAASIKEYPFHLDTRTSGQEHALVAINDGPATITLTAQIKGSNVASDRDWPLVDVIPPHSSKKLARVFAASPGLGYKFNTRYSHGFGSSQATPDANFAYRLPFRNGTKSTVGQAPGGDITTHTDADSRYAIDFDVAENTPVVASRAGTVIDVTDKFTRGGEDPSLLDKANVITILHADGTMASYVHLALHSSRVKVGDTVAAGQLLGYSGNTGYSSGPHLHFAVTKTIVRNKSIVANESLPITFYAYNPPIQFQAQQNMVLVADYEHPGSSEAPPGPSPISRVSRPVLPTSADIDQIDPESLTIEGRHDTKYWFDEVERRTGYPYWAWIGATLCTFLFLALLFELFSTFRNPAVAEG